MYIKTERVFGIYEGIRSLKKVLKTCDTFKLVIRDLPEDYISIVVLKWAEIPA